MNTYVFLDLDDTIFHSFAKCSGKERLEAVAFGRDGQPFSYMSSRQQEFLALLKRGTVIPTTARNRESLRRVRLPFESFAILNFGGVVLMPDGEIDPGWDALIRPKALDRRSALESLAKGVQRFSDERSLGVRARVISDFDMPLYVVVKHPAGDLGAVRAVFDSEVWPRSDEWFTHLNQNNLSLVPDFLGKELAVSHVIESHLEADSLILGCADSATDAAFLQRCHYAIVPSDSQLGHAIGRGIDDASGKKIGTAPSDLLKRQAGSGSPIS